MAQLQWQPAVLITLLVVAGPVAAASSVCTVSCSDPLDCTKDLQDAIAACSPEGEVVLPAGGTYLSRPVHIANTGSVTLRVDGVLRQLPEKPGPPTATYPALITVQSAGSITVTGHGRVEGNSSAWWAAHPTAAPSDVPPLVALLKLSGATVSNLTFVNPTAAAVAAEYASHVTIANITVVASADQRNDTAPAVGVDAIQTSNSVLRDAVFDVDDGACVLMHSAVSNVAVTNVSCTGGAGLAVGPLQSGGVSNVQFVNVTLANGAAASVRTVPGGSALVSNVLFANMTLDAAGPIVMDQFCPPPAASVSSAACSNASASTSPPMSNIGVVNVTGTYTGPVPGVFLCGSSLNPCSGFSMRHVRLRPAGSGPAAAFKCLNVAGSSSDVAPPACFA